uniref:Cystinosin n=1 Tax=Graphocephala atropunctata TaxID=36148 RepID=A0A1B6KMC2_9HEMI
MRFAVFVFAVLGAANNEAKLISSKGSIQLQPGKVKNITFLWNSTWLNNSRGEVLMHTKLPQIATVSPQCREIVLGLEETSWEVQIKGNRLGHTHLLALVNFTHVFSFEEGLVQITVLQYHWLQTLSVVCGYIYCFAWTISFYPQILFNVQRRSVVGLNFDFLALNELGYICYSAYNCCLFFVPSIQDEYYRRHVGATNPVLFNDVLFSVHGLFATTLQILQVFIYERGDQVVSWTATSLVSAGVFVLMATLGAAVQGYVAWLDAVLWISFIKLIVTTVKYIPQVLMNYRNKSTEGWSIECINCDLTGSCFSLLQMLMISYNCNDWVSILGDPTKFGLGLFSIGFDAVFMVQHYILYRYRYSKSPEEKKDDLVQKMQHCSSANTTTTK